MANRVTGTCCTASVERAGLPGLLRDLQRLSEDQDSADIVFILGQNEEKVYAHKIILIARIPEDIVVSSSRPDIFLYSRQLKRVILVELTVPSETNIPKDHTIKVNKYYELARNRCKSFQNTKRGEVCRIPGCTVTPVAGQPTPVRLPHVQPETFRLFTQYVYTGKLLLQDSGVFEMMTLAADLGVEDLRAACEDHVTSTLSVESACTLLAAAMEIQDRPGGKSASSFMERCISFIGDNAADCVKTNAFLNLPKEALIKLISSDFLCLEEEEVWRCALAWSKQRAGVTQPAAHWTGEERARVCGHLAPLMQHVRLLLIDSTVFAEEVEPTGAVPMELSLERYRRAALHAAPRTDPDKRTRPRLAVNLFSGSVIAAAGRGALQALVGGWCGGGGAGAGGGGSGAGGRRAWRLVFRASTHGYSAAAFHEHCDGVAPVLLLAQLSRGAVVGGYSSAGWAAGGAGGYVPAERALLFALTDPPARYPLVKKPFALCYHPDCGPIFGAGADLLISNNCNTNSDSYSNLHSYGDAASPAGLASEYNFTVRDYEIFTLDHL